jgi:hypothetical protein
VHELVNRERTGDGREEVLDRSLVAVDIEETSDNLGRSGRVDSLDIGLDGGGKVVLVEVEDKVVDEVESVADDDEGELVGELGLCKEKGFRIVSYQERLLCNEKRRIDWPLRKFLTFSGW